MPAGNPAVQGRVLNSQPLDHKSNATGGVAILITKLGINRRVDVTMKDVFEGYS